LSSLGEYFRVHCGFTSQELTNVVSLFSNILRGVRSQESGGRKKIRKKNVEPADKLFEF
jgi:hypothetical protein